jgi:hypothetical protein
MPRRITKAFFATAAAGATITTLGFAAVSPAGAAISGRHHHFTGHYFTPSGGTPIPTAANCTLTSPPVPANGCAMSGYQASGRDFRFAQALITVPNHNAVVDSDTTPAGADDPTLYVALDNSSTNSYEFARVGIAPCPSGSTLAIVPDQTTLTVCPTTGNTSGWVAFSAVQQPFGTPTVSVNPLSITTEGSGLLVNVYLEPTGNAVHFTTTLPGSGGTINNVVTVSGPVYTKAVAVADWTTALVNGTITTGVSDESPQPVVPVAKIRDSQFFQGRFTTASGTQGTFMGPWTLNALEATSNGTAPPTGTLIGQPSFLWNDGSGFNKMGSDAFGVWRFPF